MIKPNKWIKDELYIMQDNLNALNIEFSKEQAYEDYVDEKLKHIEEGCKYLRNILESEKQ